MNGHGMRAALDADSRRTPPTERPTLDHSAVLLDSDDQLWAEYPSVPSIGKDAIVPLIWAGETASSRSELEEQGWRFRLIGWSD